MALATAAEPPPSRVFLGFGAITCWAAARGVLMPCFTVQ